MLCNWANNWSCVRCQSKVCGQYSVPAPPHMPGLNLIAIPHGPSLPHALPALCPHMHAPVIAHKNDVGVVQDPQTL